MLTMTAKRRRGVVRKNSKQHLNRILIATAGFLLLLILCMVVLSPTKRGGRNNKRLLGKLNLARHEHTNKHRIAIVIPFAGKEIPAYFDTFCQAAQHSKGLVDFVIPHTGIFDTVKQQVVVPSNVILVNLESTKNMAVHLLQVMPQHESWLEQLLTSQLQQYPYILVEYKPAIGYIFRDLLKEYTHWGYSDLDIVFGDLEEYITEEELEEYDIVTYGYGDQDRVYLRGQFTIHKNNNDTIHLWRECSYLSQLDVRYKKFVESKKHFRLESAEGCYSAAVLHNDNIKIKYAVKASNDVSPHDATNTHGVCMDHGIIYKSTNGGCNLNHKLYEQTPKLQWEVGDKTAVSRDTNKTAKKCMYWAPEEYQADICVPGLKSTETVYWEHGKLYKQTHQNANLQVESAPFFHFQEWKRYYREMQLRPCMRASKCLLTKEGAIPLEFHKDNGVHHDLDSEAPYYCLRSGPRKFPPQPPTSECLKSTSWDDEDLIQIIAKPKRKVHHDAVTLVLTLQLQHEDELDLLERNLNMWQDEPSVCIIHIMDETYLDIVAERFGSMETSLIAVVVYPKMTSRNTLINMGRDAAQTRWILSGIELERGLQLSTDTLDWTQRLVQTQEHGLYLIPQFTLHFENTTLEGLLDALQQQQEEEESQVEFPDNNKMDCDEESSCGEDELEIDNAAFQSGYGAWIQWTVHELEAEDSTSVAAEIALALVDFELDLIGLLTENQVSISPILLMDTKVHGNMDMLHIIREVEEFGGTFCYNGLVLAQWAALGLRAGVVPGAFAATTPTSREVACSRRNFSLLGSSVCHGCFFFENSKDDIPGSIWEDERKRPIKSALVWQQQHLMQEDEE